MSRVEKLAELFGVEVGEVFSLDGIGCDYRLDENGLNYYSEADDMWEQTHIELNRVLELKVIKKPWIPQNGEGYYYVNAFIDCGYEKYRFYDDKADRNALSRGVIFYRTEEQVKEAVKALGWEVK